MRKLTNIMATIGLHYTARSSCECFMLTHNRLYHICSTPLLVGHSYLWPPAYQIRHYIFALRFLLSSFFIMAALCNRGHYICVQ